ncbi:MAG: hypothetical protein ACI8RZ_005546 [Myxococcota bacterium]|jgi:hypothetical protein
MQEIVLIASSSRGGSSVFSEYLRRSRALIHLQGEINPFLVRAGLGFHDTDTDSDALQARHAAQTGPLRTMLRRELGNPVETVDLPRFVDALTDRLSMQWPHLSIPRASVEAAVSTALSRLEVEAGWPADTIPEVGAFHAAFLAEIRRDFPGVSPHYYDLSRTLIGRFCPTPRPIGPPGPRIIEEPPFVTISPWQVADTLDRPVIIKTPSNAYRLPFYAALFPEARLRIIHLTRNAASAINGLYDGWRYPEGFYSIPLPGQLDIAGYSDAFSAFGRDWWQYDLPPGWREWTGQPLEAVCGFQWRSAHRAILDFTSANPDIDVHRLRFEDLIASEETARSAIDGLIDWLGITPDAPLSKTTLLTMPLVMSTDKPRHRRWFDKAALLDPVLARDDTRALMAELDYAPDPETWL